MRDVVSLEETISRADECRLLFLSQTTGHAHSPLVPFGPLGTSYCGCGLQPRGSGSVRVVDFAIQAGLGAAKMGPVR